MSTRGRTTTPMEIGSLNLVDSNESVQGAGIMCNDSSRPGRKLQQQQFRSTRFVPIIRIRSLVLILVRHIMDFVVLLPSWYICPHHVFIPRGHEYFCQIPEEFIEDDFNLTGLSSIIPMYTESLDTILDMELEETPDPDSMVVIEQVFCATFLFCILER
jgi:hypothetical protein